MTTKQNLTRAHQELFQRTPDECFDSFETLYDHCHLQREGAQESWEHPEEFLLTHDLTVCAGENGSERRLNDWSFSQLCRMAGVSKDTINRLSTKTASKALEETLPRRRRPLQLLATDDTVRAVHGVAYTRLWNVELLDVVRELAPDFRGPQPAANDMGTGLYCGEQDMFCFLIDPTGWAEIDGEASTGFFLFNSEVGRRSLGIQTFWFQAVCRNHIVWDAVEVVDYHRKHTANVHEGLDEIRRLIEQIVGRRDERRDSFVKVVRRAMTARLGDDADEVAKVLSREKLPRHLIDQAMELAGRQGEFTIFSIVDALTQLSQHIRHAGDRTELDAKAASLLALAV